MQLLILQSLTWRVKDECKHEVMPKKDTQALSFRVDSNLPHSRFLLQIDSHKWSRHMKETWKNVHLFHDHLQGQQTLHFLIPN